MQPHHSLSISITPCYFCNSSVQHSFTPQKKKRQAQVNCIISGDYQEEVGVELCSDDEVPEEPVVQEIKKGLPG
jgi:hypothetical protein